MNPRFHLTILVTGASGQLGQALQKESVNFPELQFIFLSKVELDITTMSSITEIIALHKPDVIINTAAYTAVDKSEADREKAFLLNEVGPRNLALVCKAKNIKLIHISTDYVFDGEATNPYKEDDKVNPQTVYGASKLAGENAIINSKLDSYAIIRTSWLYSTYGHNFFKTMKRLAKERQEISVVNDQLGSPTLAEDLANALLIISQQLHAGTSGIYHYSGEGSCTWYAFAKAILSNDIKNGLNLIPVSSSEFPTAAKRPSYSVLDKNKIKRTFRLSINDWKTRLEALII